MAVLIRSIIILLTVMVGIPHAAELQGLSREVHEHWGYVKDDFRAFYLDGGTLLRLGASGAAAGTLANTSADREFQEYYREDIRSGTTDGVSRVVRIPGEAVVAVPALLAWHLFLEDNRPEGWAGRSLRALVTGAPAGLALQYTTGGGRPEEGDSHWRPFKNNNGLSGHAFIGAVPFITAAKGEDDPYLKGVLYGASILPALSRINDGKHYLSQAFFGWYLAWLSVKAVDRSGAGRGGMEAGFAPFFAPFKDGFVVTLSGEF